MIWYTPPAAGIVCSSAFWPVYDEFEAEMKKITDARLELLDQYVDLELAGQDADARIPGMRAHLEGCPACQEDHESLRDLVAATQSPP